MSRENKANSRPVESGVRRRALRLRGPRERSPSEGPRLVGSPEVGCAMVEHREASQGETLTAQASPQGIGDQKAERCRAVPLVAWARIRKGVWGDYELPILNPPEAPGRRHTGERQYARRAFL